MDEKNTPHEFSLEQVAEILRDEDLDFRFEDIPGIEGARILRTGFVNAAIAFIYEGDTLVCEALWRGEFPRALATNLLAACNEYNQMQFAPTLRFYESSEEHLSANAFRILDVTHGASFNQVGAFVMSTIDSILASFDFLEKQFPSLVTWDDNAHDDHEDHEEHEEHNHEH